jgi:hypothetical protein
MAGPKGEWVEWLALEEDAIVRARCFVEGLLRFP